jgi:hypothetical protein
MDPRPSAPDLDSRLAQLRAEFTSAQPPAPTDRAIAAAIDRARKRSAKGPRSIERWLAWPLALAASIALVALAVRHMPAAEIVSPVTTAEASTASRFLPVVPAAEIERSTDAYVVPARVPRMALAQFGLPVNPERADEAIDTELLVRPDGTVLALRFVK